MLALAGLSALAATDRPEMAAEPWTPTSQPILRRHQPGESVLDRVAQRDILVHLPYESFGNSIGAFIASAARDPDVVAIKQTLYRTSDPDDPALGGEQSIVQSLIAAARSGKQVVVLVELKARFDEEANIAWARILEEAGVHVVYGVAGLKTHAKLALVVRREGDALRRYSHIGTGNYNPKTAQIYEDLGLLTADEEIGADLSELFNVLTGYGRQREYRRLLVAPTSLRDAIVAKIRSQAELGPAGAITMKVNHLVDPSIIEELYAASEAGVRVDLIVRGVCCLRPGLEMSENITVRSIVGHFLEHSRVFRFGSGGDAEYYLGSADMMPRNLNGRVETLVPISQPRLRRRLEELFIVCLADDRLAWELVDDAWTKVPARIGLNAHHRFKELASQRAVGALPDPARALDIPQLVVAAGGIVAALSEDGDPEVLLVHRPRYDDWTFPKGKLDDGEDPADGALREVLEETGYPCRLGTEVGTVEYVDRLGRNKVVHYWDMEPDEGEFTPNREVDEIRWVAVDDALDLLSYERDRALLRASRSSAD